MNWSTFVSEILRKALEEAEEETLKLRKANEEEEEEEDEVRAAPSGEGYRITMHKLEVSILRSVERDIEEIGVSAPEGREGEVVFQTLKELFEETPDANKVARAITNVASHICNTYKGEADEVAERLTRLVYGILKLERIKGRDEQETEEYKKNIFKGIRFALENFYGDDNRAYNRIKLALPTSVYDALFEEEKGMRVEAVEVPKDLNEILKNLKDVIVDYTPAGEAVELGWDSELSTTLSEQGIEPLAEMLAEADEEELENILRKLKTQVENALEEPSIAPEEIPVEGGEVIEEEETGEEIVGRAILQFLLKSLMNTEGRGKEERIKNIVRGAVSDDDEEEPNEETDEKGEKPPTDELFEEEPEEEELTETVEGEVEEPTEMPEEEAWSKGDIVKRTLVAALWDEISLLIASGDISQEKGEKIKEAIKTTLAEPWGVELKDVATFTRKLIKQLLWKAILSYLNLR